eukprot:5806657-Alexandrium_andersonii.AAC.1
MEYALRVICHARVDTPAAGIGQCSSCSCRRLSLHDCPRQPPDSFAGSHHCHAGHLILSGGVGSQAPA